jgi:uncharacterized surface protein with fasciclin (FAS1) repeats
MKRGCYATWLFFTLVLCLNLNIFSQDKEAVKEEAATVTEVQSKQSMTISKYLSFSEDFTMFVKVLKESDLFFKLESGNDLTVFAPANSAFAQMPSNVLNQLFKPENAEKLKTIAGYHIVNSALNLDEELFKLNGTTNIVAMNNEVIQVTVGPEEALVIQDANGYPIDVIEKIVLSDGIIYRIDAVLLPQVDVKVVSY